MAKHCGDIFVVRPRKSTPVDVIILDSLSKVNKLMINKSMLAGKSVQVVKAVFGATLNKIGMIHIKKV
ncbi:MAG: hypothetical protein ACSLEL_00985 [Candidatus Malihini olakiniferum]